MAVSCETRIVSRWVGRREASALSFAPALTGELALKPSPFPIEAGVACLLKTCRASGQGAVPLVSSGAQIPLSIAPKPSASSAAPFIKLALP